MTRYYQHHIMTTRRNCCFAKFVALHWDFLCGPHPSAGLMRRGHWSFLAGRSPKVLICSIIVLSISRLFLFLSINDVKALLFLSVIAGMMSIKNLSYPARFESMKGLVGSMMDADSTL